MTSLSDHQLRLHQKLQNDLEFFCKVCLRIKLKEGGESPFVWNKAQRYVHERIEDQLRRTGKVRMFLLKGRQQGMSTYIAARFYHKATRQKGRNVFILSHHADTTETLFQVVDKYHQSCPPELTPKVIINNNRRMKFANGSQYSVGTAGAGSIGRGNTNQYLHGSEVAFYANVGELITGVYQTVATADGTEVVNESTANGVGNFFHQGCMEALYGDSEYELIFIPWYWQEEYRTTPRADFKRTEEEEALKHVYQLDDAQLQWRRNKIAELKAAGHGEKKFRQEYPCSPEEAFQFSGECLIDPDKVNAAKKSNIKDPNAPLILGVDPGPVNDRTCITWRRGREWIKTETMMGMGPMELAGKIANTINKHNVSKVFIDIAEGRGVVDRLHELGFKGIVVGIPFSMRPDDGERYLNKRAEMAGALKDYIEDDLGCSIPDEDTIGVELGAIPQFKTSSGGKLQLVAKDEIKKTYGRSTDIFDSAMLTFAQPVARQYNQSSQIKKKFSRSESELSAVNDFRRKSKGRNLSDEDEASKGWTRV